MTNEMSHLKLVRKVRSLISIFDRKLDAKTFKILPCIVEKLESIADNQVILSSHNFHNNAYYFTSLSLIIGYTPI